MYPDELDDYPDDIPYLEESESINTSVYDWLGATPASTTISTDTEAAGDMLNLSMGLPELPVTQEASNLVDQAHEPLSDDDQLQKSSPQENPPLYRSTNFLVADF